MPYTPAHAIIAAPLWYGSQKKLSLPALVIGCLAPDLPYFMHLAPVFTPGHTWIGLITHAVPHGLMSLSLWYLWLEWPVLQLFGLSIPERRLGWQWGLTVLLSLWLGAASHALLDATSHQSGWFVQRISLFNLMVGPIPIFKWIQYGGGILGLGAIAIWYAIARQNQCHTSNVHPRTRWKAGLFFSLPMLSMIGLANCLHRPHSIQNVAIYSATGLMTGAVIGACIYAASIRLSLSR